MKESTKSRGGLGRLGRAFSVLRNYGVSPHRFEESLASFGRFLRRNDCPATFTCPSSLLRKSDRLTSFLKEFDVAIHGKEHIDYSQVTEHRIGNDLRQAMSDFRAVGLNPSGFRAPYLRWNSVMIRILSRFGLEYDSSASVVWNLGENRLASLNAVRRVLDYYSSQDETDAPSMPRIEHGVVRLPVSLPDDEILIERLAISNPEELLAYWLEMLKKSYEESKLLVLQIHPERFPLCVEALDSLLKEVRARSIWNASLKDVALWWKRSSTAKSNVSEPIDSIQTEGNGIWPGGHQSAFCLTGDIDAISVGDFLRRTVSGRDKEGKRRI